MSVINQNLLLTPEGYQISRSVRLRSSASAYFNRTFTTPTNNFKWTWSAWVKIGSLTSNSRLFSTGTNASGWDQAVVQLYANAGSLQLDFYQSATGSAATEFEILSSAVYRDPSAWYHIVAVYDSANATSTDRLQLYVNGVRLTAFSTTTYPSLNLASRLNAARAHDIGRYGAGSTYMDGYLTEVNFIDGQALTPSSFGETDSITGVWKPKKYAGTYGTNGFYLNFSDPSAATAAAIGKDSSGNGNNWTPNNISVTAGVTYDSMIDVPTMYADGGNGRGNYALLNSVYPSSLTGSPTVNDGNLKLTVGAASWKGSVSTISIPSSGKFYAEISNDTLTTNAGPYLCLYVVPSGQNMALDPTSNAGFYGFANGNTRYLCNGSGGFTSQTSVPLSANSVIQVAIDVDNSKVYFGINNTWYSAVNTTTSSPDAGGTQTFSLSASGYFIGTNGFGASGTENINFGQRPFTYTPPTGFKALNTQNLPDATIKKGNQYFDATTYTGNGSTQSVVNAGGFQPDLVWTKSRTGAYSHQLYDSIRGVNNFLGTNNTNAETAGTLQLTSFNSNGFTLGSNENSNTTNGYAAVGWQWKESVSAGFDIVTYTGTGANRTIAHSLGVAPKMIICKHRNAVDNWIVYHESLGGSPDYLWLNLTSAKGTSSAVWNTAPTSSVFGVGTDNLTNVSGGTYVAYLFSEVAGFSKFGSYTGNGSTDGPFVFTNMKPRFVMIKRTDSTSNWYIFDTARDTYNVMKTELLANSSNADADNSRWVDCLSNGFKIRNDNVSQINASGGTFIYAAFAENPFKNSLAR